ncbi:heterokaryon incompatibility protein-domain-containing protein [Pyrenochaeta sp. MPI-SDFR-AT-0127]|nr:heterokaryon incompatibility protein-domain-containing protein [Pyrenochaeta sp. MPI-SDFR-AT-0127]
MLELFRRLRSRQPRKYALNSPTAYVLDHDENEGVSVALRHNSHPGGGHRKSSELSWHPSPQEDPRKVTKCPYLRSTDRAWAFTSQEPLLESLAIKNTFRFLFLHPSDDSEQPVVCSLFQHTLAEEFEYTALSYEWGTPAVNGQSIKILSKKHITLNGKVIEVSPNLFDALIHVRGNLDSGMAGVLWVDALCINQNDVIERGHQVAQMRQIYHQAHQVLCWLGPATEETHSPDVKRSSRDIMQRSYWQRIWIIQEFVLARSVDLMCGELFFSVEQIEDGTTKDPDRYARLAGFYSLRDLRSRFVSNQQTNDSPLSLLEALQLSGRSRATDSRDLVYAILSLVSEKELLGLEPDYTLSPCEVFCNALWVLSNQTANSTQYIADLRHERHYRTFRNAADPHLGERKACNGKSGCQTLTKMQLWHDDSKRNSFLEPRRNSSDSIGSWSHRSASPAPRRNSASSLETPAVVDNRANRSYPPNSYFTRRFGYPNE